jgi:hypothetical protein
MRRLLLTGFLTLSLLNASVRDVCAQDAPFKLFAGVSHQEVLPQAHDALKPHVDRQMKSLSRSVSPPIAILPPEHPSREPAVTARPLVSSATSSAVRGPVLTAQNAQTQVYEPSFGVARVTADRTVAPARPVQHYSIEWFMIPTWMAGAWLKDGDMTTNVTDLRTGMSSSQREWTENRMETTWGHQQDAQGNYWHVNILPAERDGNSAGKLVRFVTVAQKCENTMPSQLLTRTHYVVSESNPWNSQPIDTFQQESLNHYALGGRNQLVNTSSNRVFTYQGAAVREGHLVSEFAKIRQFAPIANLNGIDLRASLSDYLQSHSLGHLVK